MSEAISGTALSAASAPAFRFAHAGYKLLMIRGARCKSRPDRHVSDMRRTGRQWGLMLAAAVMAWWCLYQIYCAIAYGEVLGVPNNIRWVTYAEAPAWFVATIVGGGLCAALCLAWIGASLAQRGRD
jgi:hypothetical protein